MAVAGTAEKGRGMTGQEVKAIVASSAGTIFEWYDFYLYGSLAGIIGARFFTKFDPGTQAIFALLAFASGFLVRPFGAVVFGRIGDLVGRKYTFLMTIVIMGLSTFFVGLLPDFDTWGTLAPILLIALRMAQGLALGGEYGGAAVYVAEHAPPGKRGFYTSWIQTTATLGLLLSLAVIVTLRLNMTADEFNVSYPLFFGLKGGWRIPFLLSIFLLIISIVIRLTLNESPAYQKMKEEGTQSKAPLNEAFGEWPMVMKIGVPLVLLAGLVLAYFGQMFYGFLCLMLAIAMVVANMARFTNGRIVILALFGLVVGQAVVWYTGQFYALFFLQSILKVDLLTANVLIAWSLILGTPFFIVFGIMSDKIGRKPIIMAGCLIAALTYFPIFKMITDIANPQLATALEKVNVQIKADPATCGSVFDPTGYRATTGEFKLPCDTTRRALANAAIKYNLVPGPAGSPTTVSVNGTAVAVDKDFAANVTKAAVAAGYPAANDKSIVRVSGFFAALGDSRALMLIGILTLMVIYVTMVYGPIAAALVEFFPTRIRYTAMSLPYHIGNGWFGGLMPATSFAMIAGTGDIYYGLWYPIGFALMTFVIGMLFVKDQGEKNITH